MELDHQKSTEWGVSKSYCVGYYLFMNLGYTSLGLVVVIIRQVKNYFLSSHDVVEKKTCAKSLVFLCKKLHSELMYTK